MENVINRPQPRKNENITKDKLEVLRGETPDISNLENVRVAKLGFCRHD